MTALRRHNLESAAFTVVVCIGIVWLVGDKVVRAVKGALL